MFYDAHYLFPRAWTQEQAAPGLPDASPLALFGPNRVSQSFISGMNHLAMVEIWLAGEDDEVVTIFLQDEEGPVFSGELSLSAGQAGHNYQLSFPPISDSKGREFLLTVAALNASAAQPVVIRTVGGDRLGGSLQLNEYNRPGNLALRSYANGWPGRWWLEAVGEQILPSIFRLRLQQYKPELFKGWFFTVVLIITIFLSILFLFLARPEAKPPLTKVSQTLGWALVLILGLFILWQLVEGRVKIKTFSANQSLKVIDLQLDKAPPPGTETRLMKGYHF